jgi:hypothetical protein
MSEKIKPSFTVDGKKYEFIYTRTLQLEFKRMTDEKKKDSQYQKEIAEYSMLQEQLETLQKRYLKARDEWLDNPIDEDKTAVYKALKEAYEEIHKEFVDYSTTHTAPTEADEFGLYMLGRLTLLALQEQYKLSEGEAEEVWNKFVADNGQQGSMEWLAYLGSVWLTNVDEDTENPFVQAMREKTQQADNRKAGLAKIKK